jgi:hypothetical protein
MIKAKLSVDTSLPTVRSKIGVTCPSLYLDLRTKKDR